MEALEALLNRVSVARLDEPAPTPAQRELLFRAALRAPDHGQLRPWRFLTVEGAAREQLGELFVRAQLARDPAAPAAALDKARAMPLRAPLLVVAIACLKVHPKVPESEQLLAAGCAVHGLLLAAHVQGIGAVWRTGELAYDATVHAGLNLADSERIIGFIYLGTPAGELRKPQPLQPADFVAAWPSGLGAEVER
ncbi:Nitroreductase [Geopseudomonas sagittaria]|uniref:Putative NAD(P)H nitroreductase n=1 Tax=Geopseudomonas sagittaria TaxID=1135990 RepID=A0A1I5W391_9GAMM|nr:nitroreductase family protein [Pseudomonas sagittaria]SFQ14224.1 Nitroreductase [Pseudomonas sagittaria]